MRSVFPTAILLAATCSLFAACSQVKVPDQIAVSLRGLQSEISVGRSNIVSTTTALRNLRDNRGADVKPQFTTFNNELSELESKVGGIQLLGETTRNKTNAYFEKWDKEIDQIQDNNLSAAGRERRKDVQAEYDALKDKIQKLREAYRPYYASLVDVRTLLSNDLTAQGAATARPAMNKAIDLESDVLAKLDDVTTAINKMIAQ